MHLGNAARVDGNLAFFDWTDASVAHPFIDLQSLKWEANEDEKQSIVAAYLAGWDEFAVPDKLRQAMAIAEALTPLHHAVSYQHIVANLEPVARPEVDATATFLRRVIAGADALRVD